MKKHYWYNLSGPEECNAFKDPFSRKQIFYSFDWGKRKSWSTNLLTPEEVNTASSLWSERPVELGFSKLERSKIT